MDVSKLELADLVRAVEKRCSGPPLERLAEAVRLSEKLGSLSDQVVGHFVQAARQGGATWSQIGVHLGVTKQAAHQRHGVLSLLRRRAAPSTPFDRFAQSARDVVVHAQDEARRLNHNYVGTEHILLGLLRERHAIAALVLGEHGVTIGKARTAVRREIGEGREPVSGPLSFTPRAKKTLELALREARGAGHDLVDTEHLLLALTGDLDGVGPDILAAFGVGQESVRPRILQLRAERH